MHRRPSVQEQLGLIEAFYRGVTDTAAFRDAMNRFADAFGARASALLSFDASVPKSDVSVVTGDFEGDVLARYQRDYMPFDPAPQAFSRLPIGRASSTDRMFTADEKRRSVFLNELFEPAGFVETLGGATRSAGGRFEMFGLQRGKDRAVFDKDDDRAAENIIPHMARALQVRRLLLAQDVLVANLERTLDRATAGIAILDPAGRLVFANKTAQAICQAADGLSFDRSGRLVAADAVARRSIDAQIAGVAAGESGGIVPVPRPSGRRAYAVLVAPLTAELSDQLLDATRSGAMLVVHDPELGLGAPVEALQKGLGLPRGAAELSLALAAGHDLKSFAEARGVTIHTARFHLRIALERTEANSQAGLVRLVVRFLSDMGAGW